MGWQFALASPIQILGTRPPIPHDSRPRVKQQKSGVHLCPSPEKNLEVAILVHSEQ